jgi:hypothetical protein
MNATRAVVAVVATLLSLPSTALAATPPTVSGPTPESLANKPSFSWTLGPAGEVVSSISIGPKPDVDSSGSLASTAGGGTFLYPLAALTSTTTERPLFAGTYYWTAFWKTAEGAATYESGNTAVQSFVVPSHLRTLRGTFVQYSSIPAFSAKGSFATNVRAANVTCTVFNGRARVSSQRDFVQPYIGSRTNFYCSNLKVPERLDGERLRLVVVAKGGGRSQTAVKFFRAT